MTYNLSPIKIRRTARARSYSDYIPTIETRFWRINADYRMYSRSQEMITAKSLQSSRRYITLRAVQLIDIARAWLRAAVPFRLPFHTSVYGTTTTMPAVD